MLAQELLEQPKMSNHARGLWGYSGRTAAGADLTIQSTGMGGPSAAIVLADLAKLGVRRAVRVGTSVGLDRDCRPGELLLVEAAIAGGGSAASFGIEPGEAIEPDPALLQRLRQELPDARLGRAASFDTLPADATVSEGIAAADMQTVALLARARERAVAVAAVLIVAESEAGGMLAAESVEAAAKDAGRGAAASLSP